jgi:hypothetical protein
VLRDPQHSITYTIRAPVELEGFDLSCNSKNLSLNVIVEDDEGLYDALVRGLTSNSSADAYSYLGMGDYLSPAALEIVQDVMSSGVEWLTGFICGYNDRHHVTEVQIPFRYRRSLIRRGAYGRYLPYIQQESTFWNNRLHGLVDWSQVARSRLAGDAEIWKQMANHAELTVVEAWIGGFEQRMDQLSRTLWREYQLEFTTICESLGFRSLPLVWFDWIVWHSPRLLKRVFDPTRFVYSHELRRYIRSKI